MISGKTKTYAILGDPIEQALSPIVHNAAFRATGVDGVMLGLRVSQETLPAAVQGARAMGFSGLVVTMPLKSAILPLLDSCEDKITCLGAVNLVTCENGHLRGYNTDGDGFVDNMRANGVDPSRKEIFLFGAGGAARGLCYALLAAGISRLTVCNIDAAMAQEMLASLSTHFSTPMAFLPLDSPLVADRCKQAQVIINATSMGMNDTPSPHVDLIPWAELAPTTVIADVIHKPTETALLHKAHSLGLKTLDGEGMMLCQAVLAFRLLTGQEAPKAAMLEAIQNR